MKVPNQKNVTIDDEVNAAYRFLLGDDNKSYSTKEKFHKIIQCASDKSIAANIALRTCNKQSKVIESLIEENRSLRAGIQRLQQELDAERAASTTYGHNLWNLLEELGKHKTVVRFSLHNKR